MVMPRCRIPILIVAGFLPRLPRYTVVSSRMGAPFAVRGAGDRISAILQSPLRIEPAVPLRPGCRLLRLGLLVPEPSLNWQRRDGVEVEFRVPELSGHGSTTQPPSPLISAPGAKP